MQTMPLRFVAHGDCAIRALSRNSISSQRDFSSETAWYGSLNVQVYDVEALSTWQVDYFEKKRRPSTYLVKSTRGKNTGGLSKKKMTEKASHMKLGQYKRSTTTWKNENRIIFCKGGYFFGLAYLMLSSRSPNEISTDQCAMEKTVQNAHCSRALNALWAVVL